MEMNLKVSSNQSDVDVETTSHKASKLEKYIGWKDFTLKDVLKMLFTLLIPAMIGILAVVLQKSEIDVTQKNRVNDLLISQLQRDSDEQQTQALANETIFTNYVKNMIDVILNYKSNGENSPQYNLTRVLSLTIMRQVNLEKKKLVILFLYDIEFLKRGIYIFDIYERDDDVKNLKGANLDNSDFSNGLELQNIVLRSISLINASFENSFLQGSDFTNSKLIGVQFSNTQLDGTRFIDTQLQYSNFQGASLKNIQLIRTNLTESNINDEQINQALTIFNTILPNGTYAKNKTFIINGDAKQELNGWNITYGNIQIKNFYFIGDNNSTMIQTIDVSKLSSFASYETIDYCLSFLFYGQQKLNIQLDFFSNNKRKLGQKEYPKITSSSCDNNSFDSLNFCYWSYCDNAIGSSNYIDLKIIFGSTDNTTTTIAIKNIEFTVLAQ